MKNEEYPDFPYYLYEHPGSEKYEIVDLVPKEHEIYIFKYDTIENNFITRSKYKKSLNTYNIINSKINSDGKLLDTLFAIGLCINDGSLIDDTTYYNWIIDGDKIPYSMIRPLSEEDVKDEEKWLKTFHELYEKATSVYIFNGSDQYHFKVDHLWYIMGWNKIITEEFKETYPEKYEDARLIDLEPVTPDFWLALEKRDTSIIKKLAYEVVDFEKGRGYNPINFSAGIHYMEIYMPGGDTIQFKHFGAMGVQLDIYRIPKEYGGRKDILFILQKPDERYKEHVGGLYVIRPRKKIEQLTKQMFIEKEMRYD